MQPQDGEEFPQQNFNGTNKAKTQEVCLYQNSVSLLDNLNRQLNGRKRLQYLDSAGNNVQNMYVENLTAFAFLEYTSNS